MLLSILNCLNSLFEGFEEKRPVLKHLALTDLTADEALNQIYEPLFHLQPKIKIKTPKLPKLPKRSLKNVTPAFAPIHPESFSFRPNSQVTLQRESYTRY